MKFQLYDLDLGKNAKTCFYFKNYYFLFGKKTKQNNNKQDKIFHATFLGMAFLEKDKCKAFTHEFKNIDMKRH